MRLNERLLGFFAVIEIGWTILKEAIRFVKDFVVSFSGAGGGILIFAAKTGDALVALNKALVAGGGIREFFDNLYAAIRNPIMYIKYLRDNLIEFFNTFPGFSTNAAGVEQVLGRIENRFGSLSGVSDRFRDAWGRLSSVFEGVGKILDKVWGYLSTWFSELGAKLAAAMKPGDFDAAVDVVNVGLLGGIALLLKKFLNGGLKLDLGNNFFEKISGVLDELSGKLKAMQANVKADTLMKIAVAVGLLAASMVVLSLIDSAALTKALVAMSVGFGQLVGTMALLNAVAAGPKSAVKLAVLASGLVLLSGAMVLMNTLQGFTGDLSAAQIMSMGYTKEQV